MSVKLQWNNKIYLSSKCSLQWKEGNDWSHITRQALRPLY
uniref:Uncharacterized protein n=1 Tax=Arundo donax TaxID=35708 RepID=A0A0A9EBL3_ARUDO